MRKLLAAMLSTFSNHCIIVKEKKLLKPLWSSVKIVFNYRHCSLLTTVMEF
jgi:hypothetical protein